MKKQLFFLLFALLSSLIKLIKEKQFLINELNAGIYIISVKTDKGFLSQKIFKN
jgi:hypothetical protein